MNTTTSDTLPAIAADPDLGTLSIDRKRQIVTARLDNLTVQLYELLLNRQHLIDIEAPEAQVEGLTKQRDNLRRAITLHRGEMESLGAVDSA